MLLLTLPSAFEADLKLQTNVTVISVKKKNSHRSDLCSQGWEKRERSLWIRSDVAPETAVTAGAAGGATLTQLIATPIPWCNWTFLDQPFKSNGMIHGVIFHFTTLLLKPLTAAELLHFWNKITRGGKSFCTTGSVSQNGLGHYVHAEHLRSLMTLLWATAMVL